MLGIALVSCSKSLTDDADDSSVGSFSNREGTMRAVSLQVCKEQVSMTVAPMTRTGGGTVQEIYGVNVYKANTKGTYEKYAYGLFNDPEAMTITWTHDDGTIDTSTRMITIGHNMMTTVNISFKSRQPSKVSVTEENGDMTSKVIACL